MDIILNGKVISAQEFEKMRNVPNVYLHQTSPSNYVTVSEWDVATKPELAYLKKPIVVVPVEEKPTKKTKKDD